MMDDKTKKILLDLVGLLTDLKRAISSPTLDKKTYRSKISSKVVQLRMQKGVVPAQINIDDFIKQCERVSLTLVISDIDRAIVLWQQLNKSLNLLPEDPVKSKSGLESICEKYHIEFTQSAKDEAEQKAIDTKELERIKEKYKI